MKIHSNVVLECKYAYVNMTILKMFKPFRIQLQSRLFHDDKIHTIPSKANQSDSNVYSIFIGLMEPDKKWTKAWDPHLPWWIQVTKLLNAMLRSTASFWNWACVMCVAITSKDFWVSSNILCMVVKLLLHIASVKIGMSEINLSISSPPIGSMWFLLSFRIGTKAAMADSMKIKSSIKN